MQEKLAKAKMPRPKSVRFALQGLDGETYRTLADLRAAEAVPLEYLYALHCDGTLERWLLQQHCTEELEALRALPKEQASEVYLRTLASILYPGAELDIDALVRHWKMAELWRAQRNETDDRQQNFIDTEELYYSGFRDLCQALIDDAKNMPALKEHVQQLERAYARMMRLILSDFLTFLIVHSLGSILLLLANRTFRKVLEEHKRTDDFGNNPIHYAKYLAWIFNEQRWFGDYSGSKSNVCGSYYSELAREFDRSVGAKKIQNIFNDLGCPLKIPSERIPLEIGDFLYGRSNNSKDDFSREITSLIRVNTRGQTQGWQILETEEKEYMIIFSNGYDVRPCGGKIATGVNHTWPILKGIEIKSTGEPNPQIFYIEAF